MALKYNEIGHKIKKIRKEQGMTQEKFAQKLHMTQQTLSKYENGRLPIPNDVLENISENFSIPIGYFFGIDSVALSDDEERLLEYYRNSDQRVRKSIYEVVRILATQFQGKDPEE